ncbi:MAG TPA: hypothetical protein VFE86_14190 [Ilumatobacteraceae bacterium]|nr:hypothetical protein [Ilumatobacteraceae bacterium]
MKHAEGAAKQLDEALARIERDKVVGLRLDDLRDLMVEPDPDPFEIRRSPYRAGLEDIVLTLSAAQRLPDELTVSVVLPADRAPSSPVGTAQAALRSRAADLADESWREAMAIRSMGHRQLPLGIAVGVGAAAAAYIAGYFATVVETAAVRGALVVTAMIALTIAWVVGWVVVEAAILDWRLPARRAAACELLAKATLDVTNEPPEVR